MIFFFFLKETAYTKSIYRNKLEKACFQHDMAYKDFKDLARRTASDIILRDKVFDISINPKYDRYQSGLASMAYKFFDKKSASLVNKSTAGSGVTTFANKSTQNKQLAGEVHKPAFKKNKKEKFVLDSKTIFACADLAEMQSISKFNKGFRILLCY